MKKRLSLNNIIFIVLVFSFLSLSKVYGLLPPPPAASVKTPLAGLPSLPGLPPLPGITPAPTNPVAKPVAPAKLVTPTPLPGVTPKPPAPALPKSPVISPGPKPIVPKLAAPFPGIAPFGDQAPALPAAPASLPGLPAAGPLPAPSIVSPTQSPPLGGSGLEDLDDLGASMLPPPSGAALLPAPGAPMLPGAPLLPGAPVTPALPGQPSMPGPAAPVPGQPQADVVKKTDEKKKKEVMAEGSPALSTFTQGMRVALASVRAQQTKLLKVTKKNYLSPTGFDPADPKSQFIVQRKGNWIGFSSEYLDGKTLQSDPSSFIAHFPSKNFSDDTHKNAHWAARFEGKNRPRGVVHLQSHATGGYLNFPSDDWAQGFAWTSFKQGVPAETPGPLGRFRIIKVDDIVKKVGMQKTGEKEYVYSPRLYKHRQPRYSDKWKFAKPGSGHVIFDAIGKQHIVVGISTIDGNLAEAMYVITIGEQKNTRTSIRKQVDGAAFHAVKTTVQNDVGVTGGLPKDGKTLDSYWIKVDNGTISYGKGRLVGQRELMSWKDPNKPLMVQYVGFSGDKSKVEFKNIELSGAVKETGPVNIPLGFSKIAGTMYKLSVGSKDGKLAAWGVGQDGLLYHWKTGTMAANPWEKHEAKDSSGQVLTSCNDVSISSYNDLFALFQGKAYFYDWTKKHWVQVSAGMEHGALMLDYISVGNKNQVWAVDAKNKNIYQLIKDEKTNEWKGWKLRSSSGLRVSSTLDNAVFALNEVGKVYQFDGQVWKKIKSKDAFVSLAAINRNLIIAVTKDKGVKQYQPSTGWARVAGENKKPASGFIHVGASAAGTILLGDEQGSVYKRGDDGVDPVKAERMIKQAASVSTVKKTSKKMGSLSNREKIRERRRKRKRRSKRIRKSKKRIRKSKAERRRERIKKKREER